MPSGGARSNSGPGKVPDEVKKARGTFRPDRANPSAVRLQRAKIPDAPEDLSKREREWWPVLAKAVTLVGIYTEADYVGFRSLVRTQALLERAHAGEVVGVGRDGNAEIGHRLTDIVALTRLLSVWLTSFGLIPGARDKLIAAPPSGPQEQTADPDDFEPIQ